MSTLKEDLYFNLEWYAAQVGRSYLVKPIQYYDIPTLRALIEQLKWVDEMLNKKPENS